MPKPGSNEIITGKMGRPYLQIGGPRPGNRILFYGGETNYVAIAGVEAPQLGGIDAINVHTPEAVGRYTRAGASVSPADFDSSTLTLMEKRGAIPRHLLGINCFLNAYLLHGRCKSLSDFDYGWEDYVEIYSTGRITSRSPGDRFTFDSDDGLQTDLEMTWLGGVYPAGAIAFAERAATGVTLELQDVIYANRELCGECGPANDGTGWIYAVEKGAVADKPIVHYSTDGGATGATSSIATAANAEVPCAIRLMGPYLVVLSPTANTATRGGYYYTTVNPVTGVPGSTWTKVTAGFSDAQEPRDMWVAGAREAYICTDGGEILRLTDVPAGPVSLGIVTSNDLARIRGEGDTIVAVGASATVVRSVNRGLTFSVTTTAPGAAALTAVEALDRNRIWVGNASGAVYYTLTGGETAWVAASLPGVTATAIQDIRFATDEVGYIAYTIAGTLGRLLATLNGGVSWVPSDVSNPRLLGLPTTVTQRYNRIDVPQTPTPGINANHVLLCGLGATTDGALQQGAPNVF
ncbi:MAG: hypothetical protein IT323_13555 [Anaerolineae bacterium]|nr:hypothetical protein [Anaerolineae bacterium]